MKSGKKLALVLGLATGAALAVFAGKTTKRVKHQITKKATRSLDKEDDSEVHYI